MKTGDVAGLRRREQAYIVGLTVWWLVYALGLRWIVRSTRT